MILTWLLLLALCIFVSGIFSGGETGLYSLSRMRVQAEADEGLRPARIMRRLLRDESSLLVTLLIANNLVNQLATHVGSQVLRPFGVPEKAQEVVLALLLTPLLFIFGELLPKDLFRRRPHTLVSLCAPLIAFLQIVVAPLRWPLQAISAAVSRALGMEAGVLARAQGREAVFELLHERDVALAPHMESMARNVLELRTLRVERVMVPWRKVVHVQRSMSSAALRQILSQTEFTRLPVIEAGGRVAGYVHQLEVLAADPADGPEPHLRPMIALSPATPLDRALARLRASGQRVALVGRAERPLGLVTLKDLLEEISGELHRW